MRVAGLTQNRNRGARQHEGSAHVDVLHQVVLLRGNVCRTRQINNARVVHDDVNGTKLAACFQHGVRDVIVVAHVADDRQGVAARGSDGLGGRVDRAFEGGVRGVSLGE